MPKAIPISKYVPKKFGKIELKGLRVFKLDATPKSSPIDLNVAALCGESGWNLSDRLRFWHSIILTTATDRVFILAGGRSKC